MCDIAHRLSVAVLCILCVTLLIVYLWQYCVFCIRSGENRCTTLYGALPVPYVCVFCIRSGENRCTTLYGALPVPYVPVRVTPAVHWSHICILMRLLAAEPRSTVGPIFPSQGPCGTILLTLYSMAWTGEFQEQRQCFFYCLSCSIPICL